MVRSPLVLLLVALALPAAAASVSALTLSSSDVVDDAVGPVGDVILVEDAPAEVTVTVDGSEDPDDGPGTEEDEGPAQTRERDEPQEPPRDAAPTTSLATSNPPSVASELDQATSDLVPKASPSTRDDGGNDGSHDDPPSTTGSDDAPLDIPAEDVAGSVVGLSGSATTLAAEAVSDVLATELDIDILADDEPTTGPATPPPRPAPSKEDVEVAAAAVSSPAVQASVLAVGVALQAAPAVAAARPRLRIFPLFPLYSRIEDHDVLDHDGRARIYEILQDEPGLSIEALAGRTGNARSTVRHHVRVLNDAGFVHFDYVGRERIHYPAGRRQRAVAHRLLEDPNRSTIMERLERGPATLTEIAQGIGGSPSKAHFHLRRLVNAGLVDRSGERPHYVRTDIGTE